MRMTALLFAVFGMTLLLSPLEAKNGKAPPEAAPVFALLKAVEESDVKAFRNAYSWRIREDKEQGDWEKNLQEAKANIQKKFGNCQRDDFTFTYRGDSEQGKVAFTCKGVKLELEVVKEGEWKVDTR